MDDEIKGSGNSYDFGARIYDPRVGRWLSRDFLEAKYPSNSTYSFTSNSVIMNKEKDGNEWVNVHDEEVANLQKSLLNNPDSRKLQRQLKSALQSQAEVNGVLNNLKKYDRDLYNYIDNLQVQNLKTGKLQNVKVRVEAKDMTDKSGNESASTSYSNRTSGGSRIPMDYQGEEYKEQVKNNVFLPSSKKLAPINDQDEIGFNVVIFGVKSYSDFSLANEAGDVMFRIEYPDAAMQSGSDASKLNADGTLNRTEYLRKGSAGSYSMDVEDTYKERKKNVQKGGSNKTNPYPIKK